MSILNPSMGIFLKELCPEVQLPGKVEEFFQGWSGRFPGNLRRKCSLVKIWEVVLKCINLQTWLSRNHEIFEGKKGKAFVT